MTEKTLDWWTIHIKSKLRFLLLFHNDSSDDRISDWSIVEL